MRQAPVRQLLRLLEVVCWVFLTICLGIGIGAWLTKRGQMPPKVRYEIPANMSKYTLPMVNDDDTTTLCIAANEACIPVDWLAAVWWAETNLGTNLNHVNPIDRGHFGLSHRWYAERKRKWGDYNPNRLASSARIAALELGEGYAYFGDRVRMFAEYHQGRAGVLTDGVKMAYIRRINKYLSLCSS